MSDAITRLNDALRDRYTIERQLGEGGMATVYLAEDLKHGRKVALKVLKPDLASMIGPERFLNEIEVTAGLTHPRILALHDSGEAGGFLYYVMPYVEGESLRARLDRERELPVDESLAITEAVANALDHAHRQGIVHRDIKPANILLLEGQPLIADFGIALAVSTAGGSRLTETGLSIGTPQYMSPEQAAGDRPVDGRSDVYSLGCVLYEMLAGEAPFSSGSAQAILAKKLTDTAPDVSSTRETVPTPVADALRRCLSRTPADRFQTAGDFVRAWANQAGSLAPSLAGKRVTAPDRRAIDRASAPAWLRYGLVAAIAMVMGVGVARMALSRMHEPIQLGIPLGGLEPAERSIGGILAISPDGEQIAYVAQDSAGRLLYLKSLSEPAVPIQGSDGVMSPFFSPDGGSLGFFVEDEIRRVDLRDQTPTSVAPSTGDIVGATWTEDDQIIFSQGYRQGLTAIPAGGGELAVLTRPTPGEEDSHRHPQTIPGGSLVLFEQSGRTTEIWVLDAQSGDRRMVTDGSKPKYAAGVLLFLRDETLFGLRLDERTGQRLSEPVPLLDGVGRHYALSSNGTLVYLKRSTAPNRRLVLMDLVGAQTEITTERAQFDSPSISPDGNRVAVAKPGTDGTVIWLYDLETGAAQELPAAIGGRPTWSADGSAVLYGVGTAINSLEWRGEGEAELLFELEVGQTVPWPLGWTRDGRELLYSVIDPETLGDLLRFVPGQGAQPVLDGPNPEWVGDLSPVDDRIAYTTGPSIVDMRVYLTSYPDARSRIPVSGVGALGPKWSPDGRSLYYVLGADLMAQRLDDAGRPIPEGLRTLLRFSHRPSAGLPPFDVHPDGERLVVALPDPAPPTEIIVSIGWLERVRDRLN